MTDEANRHVLSCVMDTPYSIPQETSDQAAFKAAVEQGLASLDAGHAVPYEEVRRWLLSWGSKEETLPPLPT